MYAHSIAVTFSIRYYAETVTKVKVKVKVFAIELLTSQIRVQKHFDYFGSGS